MNNQPRHSRLNQIMYGLLKAGLIDNRTYNICRSDKVAQKALFDGFGIGWRF